MRGLDRGRDSRKGETPVWLPRGTGDEGFIRGDCPGRMTGEFCVRTVRLVLLTVQLELVMDSALREAVPSSSAALFLSDALMICDLMSFLVTHSIGILSDFSTLRLP